MDQQRRDSEEEMEKEILQRKLDMNVKFDETIAEKDRDLERLEGLRKATKREMTELEEENRTMSELCKEQAAKIKELESKKKNQHRRPE